MAKVLLYIYCKFKKNYQPKILVNFWKNCSLSVSVDTFHARIFLPYRIKKKKKNYINNRIHTRWHSREKFRYILRKQNRCEESNSTIERKIVEDSMYCENEKKKKKKKPLSSNRRRNFIISHFLFFRNRIVQSTRSMTMITVFVGSQSARNRTSATLITLN